MTRRPPESECKKRKRSRLLRAALWSVGGLLALVTLYLVGVNVFLSTSLFDRVVNRKPDTILVRYERAWMILPGHVHARSVSIRSRDSTVDFYLTFDRITFDVSLLELVKERFHVKHARGTGTEFLARIKVPPWKATPEYAAHLPPIPGVTGPPVEKPKDASGSHAKPWTIQIDDARANDVRRVWIQSVRFEGTSTIAGRFLLDPLLEAYVGPADVDLDGSLQIEDREAVRGLRGHVHGDIARFDPRTITGRTLLEYVSLEAHVAGRTGDLDQIPPGVLPFAARGALDIPRLDVKAERGELANGSGIRIQLAAVSAVVGAEEISAEGEVRADLSKTIPAFLDFEGILRGATVRRHHRGSPIEQARAERIEIRGSTADLTRGAAPQLRRIEVDVDAARVPDVRAFADLIPKTAPVTLEGGRVFAPRIHVEAWPHERRLTANARVRADALAVRAAPVDLAGRSVDLEAALGEWRWDTGALRSLHVAGTLTDARLATAATPTKPVLRIDEVRAAADAPRAALSTLLGSLAVQVAVPGVDVGAPGDAVFHAPLATVTASKATPDRPATTVTLAVRDGRIRDVSALKPLLPLGKSVALEKGTGSLSARASYTPSSAAFDAALQVKLEETTLRFHESGITGTFDLTAAAKGCLKQGCGIDLGGAKLAISDAHDTGGDAAPSPWNALLGMPRGRVVVRGEPAFDAQLTLRASNAAAIVALILHDDAPPIVERATADEFLAAQTRVTVETGHVILREIEAKAGKVELHGDFVIRGGKESGGVVIDKGPFRVGIGTGKHSGVHVFGLDDWLAKNKRAADAASKAGAGGSGKAKAKEKGKKAKQ